MDRIINRSIVCIIILGSLSCQNNPEADLIITNAVIYTVNKELPEAEALAIKGDRILVVGSNEEMQEYKGSGTIEMDLERNFMMPGFIEGHGHFSGIGYSLLNLNFMNVKSWDEIVAMVKEAADDAEPGEWVVGRGWHQEKWQEDPGHTVFGYPSHHLLSEVSPDNPVLLGHASGHSLFANQKAMELAGISVETPDTQGGRIVRDAEGEAIGVFEETAQGLIRQAYQVYLEGLSQEELTEEWYNAIELAERECLSKGITSFQDAGSGFETLERYRAMAENNELDLRLWVMMRESSDGMQGSIQDYRIVNAGNYFYTCRAIKTALDGALGSFGAWLIEPYTEKPDFVGQNTVEVEEVRDIAGLAFEHNMQLCVHAIGDRANRETLNIFEEFIDKAGENPDLRWRVEHAQHIHPDDIPRFGELGVIASMQGIHCTSDAPYVEKRLGFERARDYSYPWRSLIETGAVINNGTDAPVEDVDPLKSLYASVTRKREDTGSEFFPEQKMTRIEAINSYTINNAFAAFEEDIKGSIEKGKLADLVVLNKNLLTCTDEDILATEVLFTIVGGQIKYQK